MCPVLIHPHPSPLPFSNRENPAPTARHPLTQLSSQVCACSGIGAPGLCPMGTVYSPEHRAQAPLPLVSHTPLVPMLLQAAPFSSHSSLWVSDHRYFLSRCQKYRKAQEEIGKTPASPSRRASVHVWVSIHPSFSTPNCTLNQSFRACLIISFVHGEPAFPFVNGGVLTIQPVLCQALEVPRTSRGEATLPLRGPQPRGCGDRCASTVTGPDGRLCLGHVMGRTGAWC